MKTTRYFLTGIIFFLAAGCVTVPLEEVGSKYETKLTKGPKALSGEGHLVVTKMQSQVNKIELYLNKLNRSVKNYIVWESIGAKSGPQSLGPLVLDNKASAKFTTATPFQKFEIFVTAEAALNPPQPKGEKLFWANVGQ